jgi:hypothetical protein
MDADRYQRLASQIPTQEIRNLEAKKKKKKRERQKETKDTAHPICSQASGSNILAQTWTFKGLFPHRKIRKTFIPCIAYSNNRFLASLAAIGEKVNSILCTSGHTRYFRLQIDCSSNSAVDCRPSNAVACRVPGHLLQSHRAGIRFRCRLVPALDHHWWSGSTLEL